MISVYLLLDSCGSAPLSVYLVHGVEETLQVDAHGIPVALGHVLPCRVQGIVRSTFRTETYSFHLIFA